MRKTRWLAVVFLPLILVSFLQAQSLADLAKKEKARRAAVKGKPAATITSADIAKVKKRPAVETAAEVQAGDEAAAAAGEAKTEEGAAPPAGVQAAEAAGAGAEAAQAETPPVTPPAKPDAAPAAAATAPTAADAAKSAEARTAELRKAAEDKQQLVDLLTLKMNALYQEFYSLDNMKSRELVQAQISDTYDKLLKAEMEAKQTAKDLQDHLSQAKKAGGQSIWIK